MWDVVFLLEYISDSPEDHLMLKSCDVTSDKSQVAVGVWLCLGCGCEA